MAGRRFLLQKVLRALAEGSEAENQALAEAAIKGGSSHPPSKPPPNTPTPPYTSNSDENEQLANHLIRLFATHQTSRHRKYGVNANTVRRNVDRMPQHIKDLARQAVGEDLIDYARYNDDDYTDSDDNNYFWYH